jgi:hypothetical protein
MQSNLELVACQRPWDMFWGLILCLIAHIRLCGTWFFVFLEEVVNIPKELRSVISSITIRNFVSKLSKVSN